jgi:hypothetical protein
LIGYWLKPLHLTTSHYSITLVSSVWMDLICHVRSVLFWTCSLRFNLECLKGAIWNCCRRKPPHCHGQPCKERERERETHTHHPLAWCVYESKRVRESKREGLYIYISIDHHGEVVLTNVCIWYLGRVGCETHTPTHTRSWYIFINTQVVGYIILLFLFPFCLYYVHWWWLWLYVCMLVWYTIKLNTFSFLTLLKLYSCGL